MWFNSVGPSLGGKPLIKSSPCSRAAGAELPVYNNEFYRRPSSSAGVTEGLQRKVSISSRIFGLLSPLT